MSDQKQQDNRRRGDDRWHLDKRVPIAIILTLIMQGGFFAYGYGILNNRVEQLEKSQKHLIDVRPRLVRVETLLEGVLVTLQEIKKDLRRNRDK